MPHVFTLLRQWFVETMRQHPRRRRQRDSLSPFLVIGHRGAPFFEVENTLASLQRAVEHDGANALEFDLCLTRDEQPVLWHDWDPDTPLARLREAGLEPGVYARPCPPEDETFRRPLCELTFKELCTHFGYRAQASAQSFHDCIPRLEEVFAWMRGQRQIVAFFCDIKIPTARLDLVPIMMERVNELLARYRPPGTCIFECEDVALLEAMRVHSPEHAYALDIIPPPGLVLRPAAYSAVKPALAYGNRYATPARPRATTLAPWTTHRRVVQHDVRWRRRVRRSTPGQPPPALVSFTINTEKELRSLIRLGVDGIQTDRPDLLRQIAEEMTLRLSH